MNKLEVLYEDNHIIVVVKPCNVLSQADNTHDIDMVTIIKEYLKTKYNKPGNVYLGLVHRLDRPVGGIMVFAKTSKAASRMTDMIKKHEFSKNYLAVVSGILEKDDIFIDYLLKKEDGNSIVTNESDGKYSELKYNVIDVNRKENKTLVAIELITGRHHQIRVQFSSRNHPLYGDQRYGAKNHKQIGLWAYRIKFIHPVQKKELIFTRLPNKDIEPWKMFNLEFIK